MAGKDLKQIVCVEDEPEMIDLIRLILGRKGFEVTETESGG
jgi:CheY-like chemotaxis protein